LWGQDSFNDGAGMHRVLTAARFIKARMPNGKADLSDDQAFDVAAFINTQPRPAMTNLDRDYPDRATKPIDNPYGPFADPFPIEQHRLGPFKPIEAFYEQLRRR
jgi:thiosulfate dehydrogenase